MPVGARDATPDVAAYDLVYPDGARDAESLLAHPTTGRLYVASKEVFGGTLYEAPDRARPTRPNRLRESGEVLPIATDGAFFPDGRHLVVRSYDRAVVYAFPSLEPVADLDLPDAAAGRGHRGRRRRPLLSARRASTPSAAGPAAARRARDADPAAAAEPDAATPTTGPREGEELPETTRPSAAPGPGSSPGSSAGDDRGADAVAAPTR